MIESLRSYHRDKWLFESFIIKGGKYSDVKKIFNVNTKSIEYPITAKENGVVISIDQYKGYFTGFPKIIHNNFNKSKLNTYRNLSYSQFKSSIDVLNEFIINPEDTKLSGIQLGFSIPSIIKGEDIIKLNILMFQYQYYNHNKKQDKNRELKEFVSTNYTIGVYAEKKIKGQQHFIKIILNLKKSVEFKKFGISNINDLQEKEKLRLLFESFISKFNDLIIVDSFIGQDYGQLQKFLNSRYWKDLANSKSRQTSYIHRKKFQELILKNSLNTQKLYLEKELRKAFEQFISN